MCKTPSSKLQAFSQQSIASTAMQNWLSYPGH